MVSNEDVLRATATDIRRALDELGVPTPEYPAPVANAVGILDNTLKEIEAQLDQG